MPTLDEARADLTQAVERLRFAVDDWRRVPDTDRGAKHSRETIAWNHLLGVLDRFLAVFDPLQKAGAFEKLPALAGFRADGRDVDIQIGADGISFTDQQYLLEPREVINRVERIDELFSTVAERIEGRIQADRVKDSEGLREVIADLREHSATLADHCVDFFQGPRPARFH
jgi:hypothetical protein